nr:MAG TPA_asm: hypothetical protein [Caudoviricetes sp.]
MLKLEWLISFPQLSVIGMILSLPISRASSIDKGLAIFSFIVI